MTTNKHSRACQDSSEPSVSFEQLSLNSKIHSLGQLITAITLVTEHEGSEEYSEFQHDTDLLDEIKAFLPVLIEHAGIKNILYDDSDIITFIKTHKDQLKQLSTSIYSQTLQQIINNKIEECEESSSLMADHPIAIYSELLHDFAETQFFSCDEEIAMLITRSFNYCCQKLYNACIQLEEQISKKSITTLVDCMWNFGLLEQNKNEVIYVLGGWRLSHMIVGLEEMREAYSNQSLTDLNDHDMLKLMEALAAGTAACDETCCQGICEDELEEEEDDDDDDDDNECCHQSCCKSRKN